MAAFVKLLIVIACFGALNLALLGVFRIDVLAKIGFPEVGERILYGLVGSVRCSRSCSCRACRGESWSSGTVRWCPAGWGESQSISERKTLDRSSSLRVRSASASRVFCVRPLRS